MSSLDHADQPLDGIEPGLDEVSEVVVQAYEALPESFREQWDLFGTLGPDELAERIRRDFEDRPRERREILVAYLGRRLGYKRHLHRAEDLQIKPLWDLLRLESFERLTHADREILWMVACTTQRIRQTLHPKAALAAIALWRHGSSGEQDKAEQLLVTLGLPTAMHFLYDLVRVLGTADAEGEVPHERSLHALAKLHRDHGMFDVAALMGGLYFVRRFDPWYSGAPRKNLERACDRVASERPFEYAPWILLMADAAVDGELTSSWLERILEAAIRLSVGERARHERYRGFHRRRLYEATRERIARLYRHRLARISSTRFDDVGPLLAEAEATAVDNPFRAMRLMELLVERAAGMPLSQLLRSLAELDPLTERLLVLYVRCCHIDPVAVRFVREHRDELDWSGWNLQPIDVERFLLIGDYEATFGSRDANLLGTPVAHVDKDAAARVRYFQTSRTNPNSMAKLLQNFDLPGALPVTRLAESRFVDALTTDFAQLFEERAAAMDLRDQVLSDLHRAGASVERWEDIGQLPITKIEQALMRGRQRDMIVGALAGGVAGALAPQTSGVSAIMDVPFLMALVADTCARHCWYYGFDPRDHADLVTKIVAIALGGLEAADMTDAEVRSALKGYLTRRSILLAALGQGAVAQIAGPAAGMLWDHVGRFQRRPPLLVAALENVARRDQRPRFTKRMVKYVLPVADGFLGTAFNVSLVYDLGESAQAVLADRFLARKYRDWEPRF